MANVQARLAQSRAIDLSTEAIQLKISADEIEKNIAAEEAKPECGALVGQEKYEADREKRQAQKVIEQKRAEAKQLDSSADDSFAAAKMFTKQAKARRETAERLRKL